MHCQTDDARGPAPEHHGPAHSRPVGLNNSRPVDRNNSRITAPWAILRGHVAAQSSTSAVLTSLGAPTKALALRAGFASRVQARTRTPPHTARRTVFLVTPPRSWLPRLPVPPALDLRGQGHPDRKSLPSRLLCIASARGPLFSRPTRSSTPRPGASLQTAEVASMLHVSTPAQDRH